MKQKSNVSRKLDELKMKLEQRQSDQQEILLERIRDKAHEEIYTKMLKICEDDIERLKNEIESITDYNTTIQKRKAEMKESVNCTKESSPAEKNNRQTGKYRVNFTSNTSENALNPKLKRREFPTVIPTLVMELVPLPELFLKSLTTIPKTLTSKENVSKPRKTALLSVPFSV